MSLVTTCPACTTTFRITPEQLAAHRGDVRCGQCQHIFSALQQLQEIEAAAAASRRAAEQQPAVAPLPAEEPEFEHTVVLPAPLTIEAATPVAELEPIFQQPEPLAEAELVQADRFSAESVESSATVDFELDFSDSQPPPEPEPEAQLAALESAEPLPTQSEPAQPDAAIPAMAEPEPVSETMAVQPSQDIPVALPEFLQPARRGASWWVMLPLLLLLLILAAGQVVFFQRTEITAYYPPARPLLERACLLLRCEVGLPRHADLLNIEDSDLQDDADHPGVLVLASVLYNRAPYPQAYPLLELTLTDTYDKPVLRRTFQPKDYLPAGSDFKSGISAGGEIRSRLALAVSGDKPAGYRLYVRY